MGGGAALGDQVPPEEGEGWPGVAPPAGWFLRPPAGHDDQAGVGVPADTAASLGESPITWSRDMDDAGTGAGPADPAGEEQAGPVSPAPAAEPAVGVTRALWGRAGGPGFQPRRPATGARRPSAGQSPWQTSHRLWRESDIQWDHHPAPGTSRAAGPGSLPPGLADGAWPGYMQVPLGAPVFAEPETDVSTDPDLEPEAGQDTWGAASGPDPGYDEPAPAARRAMAQETLLLEPALPGTWRPKARRGLRSRRTATIAVPVMVLAAVAILALALLTGHGPKFGQLAANQQPKQQPNQGMTGQSALTIGMYAGQEQRAVFQSISRVAGWGNTIVTTGSQISDGVTRQQFFVSANGGMSWRLASLQAPGGGQPALGYTASRLAGGPGGWLAEGPQALWTSPDGRSWTLAATHGITPQLPGDQIFVLTSTAQGFVAGGQGRAADGGTQAVIWTSRDGLTWQRLTAAQLGLAAPGETVTAIFYATWRGDDTVISGQVAKGGTSYYATWLSTDGGSAWTRVTVPADHGAGTSISGLGFDESGLLAVRPGRSPGGADGVAYFSADGRQWQYAGTIDPAGGWSPGLIKGNDDGFVASGTTAAGQIVAYTSAGAGGSWQPTGSLGTAAGESVVGATVGPAGTIVAVGAASGNPAGQQPVFLEANAAGSVRPVSLASIPGGIVPELAVNGLAVADGRQVAVGSADGYPAVWRRASDGGSWSLVSSLAQVSAGSGLRALTGVTHGSAGWLAVGVPGPVVLTSADGTSWRSATGPGSITDDLGNVLAIATAAGPAGYVIVGKLKAPSGVCVADVWWSPNLTTWTRAHDVNDVTGSSQVLAVAADAHGFVSVGSHDAKPAVWTTTDGRTWTTIVLPMPAGSYLAQLQQVAIGGSRVVALGQAFTKAGVLPFAELSVNGGTSWSQVPIGPPGPGISFTALTTGPAGFAATAQFGPHGQQEVAAWTSANGTVWAPSQISGVTGPHAGGSYQLNALAAAGSGVTGIGSIATQQSQEVFTVKLPGR